MEVLVNKMRTTDCSDARERLARALEALARARLQSQTQELKRGETLVEQLLEENRRLWDLVQDEYRRLSGYERVPTTREERRGDPGSESDNAREKALVALESRPERLARAGEFMDVTI